MQLPSHTRRKLASFSRKASRFILIFLGVALLGGVYYILATLGPSRVTQAPPKAEDINDPAILELVKQVDDLEKQYQQVADAKLQTPEAIKALEEAIEKQREVVRRLPLSSYEQINRLNRLETKRDSAHAREMIARIEVLEREGNAAATRGDNAQAHVDLTEALRLQREINTTQASPQLKNYRRETSLSQAIANIEVDPVNKQKETALETYRTALKEKRWHDALISLTNARDLQAKINYDYPRTRYTDLQAIEKLDADIASLNATDAITEIETNIKAAETAELAADYTKAAELYGKAATRQREINTTHPRSRFVSSPRVEEYEIKQQTALSRDIDNQLTSLSNSIAEALSLRHIIVAEEQLTTAIALVGKLETDYPRSRLNNPARKLKLAYLNVKKTSLGAIQDAAYARAALVPGLTPLQFGGTEVTQDLYRQVMNTNPSRNPGGKLPVESISWNEASEFCTRLGWIMGMQVRLPTETEYRAALKGGPGGIRAKSASTTTTGEVATLPANEYGVYDLLGNVAEWLASSNSELDATHIGGSYLSDPSTLNADNPPKAKLAKNERARDVGFRYTIAPIGSESDATILPPDPTETPQPETTPPPPPAPATEPTPTPETPPEKAPKPTIESTSPPSAEHSAVQAAEKSTQPTPPADTPAKPEPKPTDKPADEPTKPADKPEPAAPATAETKTPADTEKTTPSPTQTKPEAKPDAKPEAKTTAKPEVKPETKSKPTIEPEPAEPQPEAKPEPKPTPKRKYGPPSRRR